MNHLHYSTTGSCQKGSKQMHCPNPDVNYLCSTTPISVYTPDPSPGTFKVVFRAVTMHWFRKLSCETLTTSPQWLVVENHSWIYLCKKNVVCTFISCNFYFVIIFPLLHECRESVEDELARISFSIELWAHARIVYSGYLTWYILCFTFHRCNQVSLLLGDLWRGLRYCTCSLFSLHCSSTSGISLVDFLPSFPHKVA